MNLVYKDRISPKLVSDKHISVEVEGTVIRLSDDHGSSISMRFSQFDKLVESMERIREAKSREHLLEIK